MAGQGVPLRKVCGSCRVEKRLSDFYYNKTKSDYHNGICKKCQLESDKKNRAKPKMATFMVETSN